MRGWFILSIFIRNPYSREEYSIKSEKRCRATLPDYRFIVMADSRGTDGGINEKTLRSILGKIKDLYPQPDYIIFPGDLVSGSSTPENLRAQLQKFKDVFMEYFPIKILLPTVGNHEVSNDPKDYSSEKVFAEIFSEFKTDEFLGGYNRTVFYVDIGNVRHIVLNSYHTGEINEITGQQFEWFKKVSEGTQKRKLVFVHSPAYPTGHHIDSSLSLFPEQRDKFWNVVDMNTVDLLFAGHEHNYSRRLIDSSFSTKDYKFTRKVNQVVTGGAGAPLNDAYKDDRGIVVPPTPVYHYVIVDVYGNELKITAVALDSGKIDEFII